MARLPARDLRNPLDEILAYLPGAAGKAAHQVVRAARSFEPPDMGGHKRLRGTRLARPVKLGRIEPTAPGHSSGGFEPFQRGGFDLGLGKIYAAVSAMASRNTAKLWDRLRAGSKCRPIAVAACTLANPCLK